MKPKLNGKKKKKFDFDESFMMRVAGIDDEVLVCKVMRELLIKVREVFLVASISKEEFSVLEHATKSIEKTFSGEECKDLFDVLYQLGVILVDLGFEDLGVTCQYLHHTYRGLAYPSWPPSKAWYRGRGGELEMMLPIFKVSFEAFEADTSRDGECVRG